MKVLIAVPTYETISPDTFKSIYDLRTGKHKCQFEFVRGYDCAAARNNIAQKALDTEADYVFMVDSDIILPKHALLTLMRGSPEICLGYYRHRTLGELNSEKSIMYRPGEFNFSMQFFMNELKEKANQKDPRVEVHGGGLGCALIHTDLFKKIQKPWFRWIIYPSGDVLSEDLYFCDQCNQNGIKIYTDARVNCGHIMPKVQW